MKDATSPTVPVRYQVEVVDTFAGFEALRPVWQRLQKRDMEATVFLTWEWLAEAFRENTWRWSVIVVRAPDASGEAVCILPLKYRVHWSRSRRELHTQLEAGGRLLWSEYTGFLCDPEHEAGGLAAAARKLAVLPWSQLSMRYVAQARRVKIFTDKLADLGFAVRFKDYRINKGEIDNLICPQVDLPETFEGYLKEQVSANTRQRYNKIRRRHLDAGPYHFHHATDETVDRDIATLLTFWQQKWGPQKGQSAAERVAGNYRDVLTAAHRTGALFLPMLQKEDQTLGALGHVLDRQNGIAHFIVAGRDTAAEESFIGDALHFHSIAWAIEHGLICYDFAHGNERYKYSYGAQEMTTLFFEVRRPGKDASKVFDIMCAGEALKRTEQFLRQGKPERAMRVCAQLSSLLS